MISVLYIIRVLHSLIRLVSQKSILNGTTRYSNSLRGKSENFKISPDEEHESMRKDISLLRT